MTDMGTFGKSDQPFWNPVLETLDRERIKQLQFAKFKKIFKWAYDNSRFHGKLYRDAGIEPGDINSFEDIRKIPKVEKSMMQQVQRKDPFPYGEALCVPIEEVTEFRQTSGTTGSPVYQPDTWQDWEWWSECWAYILWAQGYRPYDRVFIPFGYNIFVAFWAGHYAAEKIGCEVVPGGVLDTETRILKIQELKANAMMGTPTYMLNMAETALNKMGIEPSKLGIDKITCAGEPGASIPSTRQRIENAWNARVYDHAGATEIGAWSYECQAQSGGLHVNEAFFLVEIEDIATGIIIDEPDKQGKMVITAFDRIAQPCIRFDSKDIIMWESGSCACGRTFRRIKGGVLGRTDDITKVKGVLLSPAAIEAVVRSMPELSNEYRVVVDRIKGHDIIALDVELMPGNGKDHENIRTKLAKRLRLKTNIGYVINFHDYGKLSRFEVKAKRFTDKRSKSGIKM